jgi:hypothetical protein
MDALSTVPYIRTGNYRTPFVEKIWYVVIFIPFALQSIAKSFVFG